jgi:hypothetical protein
MAHEFNVLALVKGAERYVYVYDEASRPQLAAAIRAQASDSELSLTWFDALVLTKKAREQAAEAGFNPAVDPEAVLPPSRAEEG